MFSIEYSIDWQKLADDEMFDGIYILRTNLDKEAFPMLSILKSYKEQPVVEKCFETVKQPPIQISPVWLHKPQRIESLLFCVFVALFACDRTRDDGASAERGARQSLAEKDCFTS